MTDVWHVVHGDDMRELLQRCHDGEDPDLVYLEWYVNAERETDA